MRSIAWIAAGSLAVGASIVSTGSTVPIAHAAGVPSGFADDSVGSFSRPTAVEWLPNSKVVVLEQAGDVHVIDDDGGSTEALDLDVCSSGERGLLGFTHDTGFLGNGWVYLYYTRPEPAAPGGCVNRVSRFTMSGSTIDPASEVVLLDNISSVNTNHNGGDLDIGADGHLYVAVGDAGRDPRGDSTSGGGNDAGQDTSLLNGKILRITRDGRPAPGNPFTGAGTARCAFRGNTPDTPTTDCQEIYAWGLRNPYRIAFDRNSDRFFINDVGQGSREEVDLGEVGANYGWPVREGVCPQGQNPPCPADSSYTDPIADYPRAYGTYITAGAFVPDGLWPSDYDGAYLFGDGGSGNVYLRAADGSVDYDQPFATGVWGITDMTFGFDDGTMVLYYTLHGGELRVITPTGSPADLPGNRLRLEPITPTRAYDTGQGIGVAVGDVFNGSTRRVDLDPPAFTSAALVNVTYADTAGPGYLSTWATRRPRPSTSTINVDTAGGFVANAAVVPLDDEGAFMVESASTGRVIIDVLGWFRDLGVPTSEGRVIGLPPLRLADTRLPPGEPLDSGSPNPWTRSGDLIDVEVLAHAGLPASGVDAVVLSIAAIASGGPGGFVGAYPGGGTYAGTSNVNVVAGDVRANMVLVPLEGAGHVSFETLNIAGVVVDVLGYVTDDTATSGDEGLFRLVAPYRAADSRTGTPFSRLGPLQPVTLDIASQQSAGTVVQNITATATSGPGWLAAHLPGDSVPEVSSLNYTGAGQTRAALAFSKVSASGEIAYTSMVDTDLVVDVVGIFTE